MLGGVREMLLDAGDLDPEGLDPFIELIDRQGAKVLLDEQGQWVARPAGEEIIVVHGGRNR